MLTNTQNFIKLYHTAQSCKTKAHIKITFKWANKFRSSFRLTEFEYMKIESVLLEKLKLPNKSRWNQKLDINDLLEKTSIK